MTARGGTIIVAMGLAVALAGPAQGDPLAVYRWRSRVLVLAGPAADDARLKAQRALLAAATPGLSERDLVTIEAVGVTAEAVALRLRFALPPDAFRAVLVGKDGDAKLVSAEPIPVEALFATIDAMPMRRDEMRRDGIRR